MKKTLFSVLVFILFFLVFSAMPNVFSQAFATATEYLYIDGDSVPFFKDENLSDFLFYLPKTYYAKIIYSNELYYKVEIYGGDTPMLDGFVPIDASSPTQKTDGDLFPDFSIKTSVNSPLYSDRQLTDVIQYVFSDRELRFYGYSYSAENESLIFVGYNGKLGFIKSTDVKSFTMPQNKVEEPETETHTVTGQSSSDDFSSLKIIVIACLVFAGVIAFFIVKRPIKEKTDEGYYDENDFE